MTSASLGRESAPIRAVASGVFTYELVALWTNLPTITRLNQVFPPLGAAIVVGLAVHFYAPPRRKSS